MRKRPLIKNLTLSFISVIFALIAVELILGVINYEYTPLKIVTIKKTVNNYDWRDHFIFEDKDFTYDPYLIWRPKKNCSVFNSEGYRGRELYSCKGPKTYCIFTFGDSNTLGISGESGPNWPGYLDDIVKSSDMDCLVINAGVWGYTSFQGLRRFKEALSFKPNMILVCFGANEPCRVVSPDKRYISDRFGIRSKIYKYRTGLFLISLFDRYFSRQVEALEPRVSIDDYEKDLREMVRICVKNNIKIIFLTRPFIGATSDKLWWKNFAPQYNDIVKKVSKEKNVMLIDLYGYFNNKGSYFYDESHFNKEGHEIAAKIIYKEIKNYLPRLKK